MASVRVIADTRVWYAPSSQLLELRRGQVLHGDQAVYLLANLPGGVVDLDPPASVAVDTKSESVDTKSEPSAPAPALTVVETFSLDEPPSIGAGGSDDPAPPAPGVSVFDPCLHTAPQVITYAREHPDEAEALWAAENDPTYGKQRMSVLTALDSLRQR